MADEIDIIDELGEPKQQPSQLERDVATFRQDIRNIGYQVSYAMNSIRGRAGRHGMNAIRAELTPQERASTGKVLKAADKLLKAVAKNHDPGPMPDDPDPEPVEPITP